MLGSTELKGSSCCQGVEPLQRNWLRAVMLGTLELKRFLLGVKTWSSNTDARVLLRVCGHARQRGARRFLHIVKAWSNSNEIVLCAVMLGSEEIKRCFLGVKTWSTSIEPVIFFAVAVMLGSVEPKKNLPRCQGVEHQQ